MLVWSQARVCRFWEGLEPERDLAVRAHITGESLDALYAKSRRAQSLQCLEGEAGRPSKDDEV